jgi:hypothetical protein
MCEDLDGSERKRGESDDQKGERNAWDLLRNLLKIVLVSFLIDLCLQEIAIGNQTLKKHSVLLLIRPCTFLSKHSWL